MPGWEPPPASAPMPGREIDPVISGLISTLVSYLGLGDGRPLRIEIAYDGTTPTGIVILEER